jgi:sulfane dehydrogenase subunit SoxC
MPDSSPAPKFTRRTLLGGAATAAVALVTAPVAKALQVGRTARELATDPPRVPGTPPGEVGTRSAFEKLVKKPSDISSRTPLQDLHGILTPSDLHFERHHAGVPALDPAQHELVIHGLVDRPMTFTMAELRRFPSISRIAFLECSGNFRTGRETMSPQEICGLTSQSEWTGVSLATIFREVGVKPTASWFLAEGGDACRMTRSIPVQKGWDDAILAYAQNGEALRPEQGYPLRLFLPGWESNANVKWLRRLELGDQPWHTRQETARYTETLRDGSIRQFSFVIDARSIITFPAYPHRVERGWIEIRGLAWSGRGKVAQVEVSTDAGRTWQPARLQEPILDKAHVAFRYLWHWNGEETELLSRVTDETGYRQPTFAQLVDVRGERGGYHFNPITAWLLKKDGTVLHRPETV